ncbi:3-phosphoshikimate 1-carboxyvinyltransferase [Segetibacter aerophilus]|uniref:3-phosphoshikimate 1-carboxyvinyltransferase n=1 Tax=Segetibacter aerophilus TaxID=670293 RepID=A0A512BFW1_9BACT|nr:3-phosphoshikimate 1-carboxyvinyltransferase [Segetibacter aerophilus]GEO10846.1 3-phosphoshikimate 1-carboxyvinyltransferase [Segetibacter aerophilus]
MIVKIKPSVLTGSVIAPASKSSMQRACAAALLSEGASEIINPGKSNDDLAALDVIQKLGARVVENEDGSITIHSLGVDPIEEEINCGESGLGIRMFTPIAALSNGHITINGTGSLSTRPMHFFDEIFPKLNIKIHSREGKLPLQIQGPLVPSDIEVDGSLSSQFLTGLLMAYGASVTKPVSIKVNNLKSKPYIDLTLKVMESFGRKVTHTNYEVFHLEPQGKNYEPQVYTVEGDWSGAAFLLVAGAISGKITVKGLDLLSTQADREVMRALKDCECDLTVGPNAINIGPPTDLKAFDFDATDCPDLFPPLVALAAYCGGTSTIKGVSRLAHKESNRGLTLQEEFGKMGTKITLQDDLMLIEGGSELFGTTVHSRHDHRIAMACAVAALQADDEVTIEDAEAINKSYPDFYRHLQKLGATVNF